MIREDIIKFYIKDKDILDIGSVGQTEAYSLWDIYKDTKIKSLTGIDLPDAPQIAVDSFKINREKINSDVRIVYGNMENYNFNREFDVIIAGDVLEHVDNQGLFLNNIKKHLCRNGKLILTTPNAKSVAVLFKPNPTHTIWHDKYTLYTILDRTGFKLERLLYYPGNKKYYNPLIRLICMRQGMLAICSIKMT